MIEKELFIKALRTIFFSWGMDTPVEVFWGCNELLDWYEKEYNISLGIRFDEENGYSNGDDNFEDVIEAIRNS